MSLTRPEHPWRVALVVVAGVILVNVVDLGRAQSGERSAERPAAGRDPAAVPRRGRARCSRRATVGVDLRDQFTGQITIDGRLIPQDQITGDPSLGIILFAPGPGKEFTEFTKGPHTAVARMVAPHDRDARSRGARSNNSAATAGSFNVG